MKKCMNCGAELPEEASFCPHCTAIQNEKHQLVPRWPRRKWLWIVGGAAAALAIAVLCLWGLRDDAPKAGLPVTDVQAPQSAAAGSPSVSQTPQPTDSAYGRQTLQPTDSADDIQTPQPTPPPENTADDAFPLDTSVDIRAELQPGTNVANSQEVLLHLVPEEDGIYIFNIAGTPLADAHPMPGGIDILDDPMVEASGMYGDTWGMHDYIFVRCFKLEAGRSYDFRLWIPAAELDLTQPFTATVTKDWTFVDDVMYDVTLAVNDSIYGSVNIKLGEFMAMADSLELDESYDHAVVSAIWNPQQKNDLLITGLSGGTASINVNATFMGETKPVTFTVSVFDGVSGHGG